MRLTPDGVFSEGLTIRKNVERRGEIHYGGLVCSARYDSAMSTSNVTAAMGVDLGSSARQIGPMASHMNADHRVPPLLSRSTPKQLELVGC
jgi:hypothetical protein